MFGFPALVQLLICTRYRVRSIYALSTCSYSAHIEAPTRRKPDGRFEVVSEKFSGELVKAQ
jgi:hypothetical protein